MGLSSFIPTAYPRTTLVKFWTFTIADSGRFEDPDSTRDRKAPEEVALLVGGILCEGEARFLDTRWRKPLREACASAGLAFPLHPGRLDSNAKVALLEAAGKLLGGMRAYLVIVVAPPPEQPDPDLDFARYVRMLGEAVDLAARLAAAGGAETLDVRAAQRSVPLSDAKAASARRKGFDVPREAGAGTRAMAEAEIRQVFDALAREPRGALPPAPSLRSAEAISSQDPNSHPGVSLAALFCNHLYARLANPREVEAPARERLALKALGDVLPFAIAREALTDVREVDRALRDRSPDLVHAARAIARLEGHARGDSPELSPFRVAREGAAAAARHLWRGALSAIPPTTDEEMARVLAARADVHLGAKSGDYEGTWNALDGGWFGRGPLASRVRASITDRELSARLARLVLECANHRGDVESGTAAAALFERAIAPGLSLSLLAERLTVRNLSAVLGQNLLPAEPNEVVSTLLRLREDAEALVKAADEAGRVLATSEPPSEPSFNEPDRERGRCYGTAARSFAFIGDLVRARDLALRARSHFEGSPFDLRFNATVTARIELEDARRATERAAPNSALVTALALCGPTLLPDDAEDRIRETPAARFLLDLLLRTALWTQYAREDWLRALEATGKRSLHARLSAGELRSHPTELIARHAAELVGGESARRWFALSRAICDEAPSGTMRRFALFTAHISAGRRPEGALGAILNPTFEFR